MRDAIHNVVENGRVLKALLDNHPGAASITDCTVHCSDSEEVRPSVAFLNEDRNLVMVVFGGGWTIRNNHRGGIDATKMVDGVSLIIRDFTLTGTHPVETRNQANQIVT